MEYTSTIHLGSEVSFALCLIDDYTAKIIQSSNIHVFIQDVPVRPIKKPDGYYVFTSLPEGIYKVVIVSEQYVTESMEVSTKTLEAHRLVTVKLKPKVSYAFPNGATLIRSQIFNAQLQPVPDVNVRATVLTDSCERARVAKSGAKENEKAVDIVSISGAIVLEDCFLLKDKSNGASELCKVRHFDREASRLVLDEPLKFSYGRGAVFLPVVFSVSNEKGEIVLYFRNVHHRNFDVELEFSYRGHTLMQTLAVEEGKTTYTGRITI